jgi:hypothetical protein
MPLIVSFSSLSIIRLLLISEYRQCQYKIIKKDNESIELCNCLTVRRETKQKGTLIMNRTNQRFVLNCHKQLR